MQILNARGLKCTIVLDPAEVAQIVTPRRPPTRCARHQAAGPARQLVGDAITEAGIVAQPKVRAQAVAA
jgi:hypothetical protein